MIRVAVVGSEWWRASSMQAISWSRCFFFDEILALRIPNGGVKGGWRGSVEGGSYAMGFLHLACIFR